MIYTATTANLIAKGDLLTAESVKAIQESIQSDLKREKYLIDPRGQVTAKNAVVSERGSLVKKLEGDLDQAKLNEVGVV
jgi:hypothetical protein